MGTPSTSNVEFLTCKLEVGTYGGAYAEVGFVNAIKVGLKYNYYDVENDYRLLPLFTIKTGVEATVSADLQEFTVTNLAYGLGTTDVTSPIAIGYSQTVDYFKVKITGVLKNGSSTTVWEFPKVQMDANFELAFTMKKEVIIPVSFKAVVDDSSGNILTVTQA